MNFIGHKIERKEEKSQQSSHFGDFYLWDYKGYVEEFIFFGPAHLRQQLQEAYFILNCSSEFLIGGFGKTVLLVKS